MTEPTKEQVGDQRSRAHALARSVYRCNDPKMNAPHSNHCTDIATALARVRIEAHAAGRDDGLIAAEGVSSVLGRCVCNHCELAVKSIRALRDKSQ